MSWRVRYFPDGAISSKIERCFSPIVSTAPVAPLRAIAQAALSALTDYTAHDACVLEEVRAAAHELIRRDRLTAPGCDPVVIKSVAELVVDKIVASATNKDT